MKSEQKKKKLKANNIQNKKSQNKKQNKKQTSIKSTIFRLIKINPQKITSYTHNTNFIATSKTTTLSLYTKRTFTHVLSLQFPTNIKLLQLTHNTIIIILPTELRIINLSTLDQQIININCNIHKIASYNDDVYFCDETCVYKLVGSDIVTLFRHKSRIECLYADTDILIIDSFGYLTIIKNDNNINNYINNNIKKEFFVGDYGFTGVAKTKCNEYALITKKGNLIYVDVERECIVKDVRVRDTPLTCIVSTNHHNYNNDDVITNNTYQIQNQIENNEINYQIEKNDVFVAGIDNRLIHIKNYKKGCQTDSHNAPVTGMFTDKNRIITISDDFSLCVHSLNTQNTGFIFRRVYLEDVRVNFCKNFVVVNEGEKLNIYQIFNSYNKKDIDGSVLKGIYRNKDTYKNGAEVNRETSILGNDETSILGNHEASILGNDETSKYGNNINENVTNENEINENVTNENQINENEINENEINDNNLISLANTELEDIYSTRAYNFICQITTKEKITSHTINKSASLFAFTTPTHTFIYQIKNKKFEQLKVLEPSIDLTFFKDFFCYTTYKKELKIIYLKGSIKKTVLLDCFGDKLKSTDEYLVLTQSGLVFDQKLNVVELGRKIEDCCEDDGVLYFLIRNDDILFGTSLDNNNTVNNNVKDNSNKLDNINNINDNNKKDNMNHKANTDYVIYKYKNKKYHKITDIQNTLHISGMFFIKKKLYLYNHELIMRVDVKTNVVERCFIGPLILGCGEFEGNLIIGQFCQEEFEEFYEGNGRVKLKWSKKVLNKV